MTYAHDQDLDSILVGIQCFCKATTRIIWRLIQRHLAKLKSTL